MCAQRRQEFAGGSLFTENLIGSCGQETWARRHLKIITKEIKKKNTKTGKKKKVAEESPPP